MIGVEQVAALPGRQEVDEAAPDLGGEAAHAVQEPVDLAGAAEEDAAQHQAAAALGMGLGVGERQRAAPRAAEHQPALDAEMLAQPLDVGDEMPGGIVDDVALRPRAAGAALVEQHGPVVAGVEEAALRRAAAGAGPTMQQQDGIAGRLDALLPVHHVALVERQLAGGERLDLRVELAALHKAPAAVLLAATPIYQPRPARPPCRRPNRPAPVGFPA